VNDIPISKSPIEIRAQLINEEIRHERGDRASLERLVLEFFALWLADGQPVPDNALDQIWDADFTTLEKRMYSATEANATVKELVDQVLDEDLRRRLLMAVEEVRFELEDATTQLECQFSAERPELRSYSNAVDHVTATKSVAWSLEPGQFALQQFEGPGSVVPYRQLLTTIMSRSGGTKKSAEQVIRRLKKNGYIERAFDKRGSPLVRTPKDV
jgi:hypothetical protein